MLTPTEKGSIAEAKLAAAAIELGMRVQRKYSARKGDVIVVRMRTTRGRF